MYDEEIKIESRDYWLKVVDFINIIPLIIHTNMLSLFHIRDFVLSET